MRNQALASRIMRLMAAAIILTLAMVLGPHGWIAQDAEIGTRRIFEGGLTASFAALVPLSLALAVFLGLAVAATLLARRIARERNQSGPRSARTDPLTGLPNRLAFSETLVRSLREPRVACVLLVMDVNGFRRVNDAIGHGGGDGLIVQLADRLRRLLPHDASLSRVDGDEFTVIFRGSDAEALAERFCATLAETLEPPFLVEDHSFRITIAMGYATTPSGLLSAGELVRRADLAMYEAKNRRTVRPIKYDPSLENDTLRRREIEEALRRGMEGELLVHYQPICDATSGDMVMAEALMRWSSPKLGRVPPTRFIPVAEGTGLILDLGYRLIEQVCRDLKSWPQLRVSVNVSPVQLREAGFIETMTAIIERHGIAPGRIELELTEELLVENPDLAAFKLDNLREAGHWIVLDDFGTGFSSIGYLRKLNFDKLKIGKALVDDIGAGPDAERVLQSLSLLARALNLETVAEGVEGADQAARLREMGFDLLQGHHFGRAAPLETLKTTFGNRLGTVSP